MCRFRAALSPPLSHPSVARITKSGQKTGARGTVWLLGKAFGQRVCSVSCFFQRDKFCQPWAKPPSHSLPTSTSHPGLLSSLKTSFMRKINSHHVWLHQFLISNTCGKSNCKQHPCMLRPNKRLHHKWEIIHTKSTVVNREFNYTKHLLKHWG